MENRLNESQECKHTDHLGSGPGKYQITEACSRILAVDVEMWSYRFGYSLKVNVTRLDKRQCWMRR